MQTEIRNNWTKEEVAEIYNMPLMELMYKASVIHKEFQKTGEVQVCTLLSVKTGGCKEDCSYCSQSARYSTHVKPHKLMQKDEVIEKAKQAKDNGSTRFCMGAAWREARSNKDFDNVLGMVSEINDMGMEVCATLGMLDENQADQLKKAGLYAYNHNLDTSREYYDKVITTRTFDDRLETIANVQKAKISVCSGGIIGLGEKDNDRIAMLYTLSTLPTHPESVPVNALVPVEGTPMEGNKMVSTWEMIRMIATARILMPKAMVRLSAGRTEMSTEAQALCFMAGANSIFAGDELLTTPNPEEDADKQMFNLLGLTPRASFKEEIEATPTI
ncbi:biotin synthase BioB [Flammeovirga pacifica]|uniref:Biotin synthase n=1 Tax=Flammeovirga pacifica TaxID=915059 RepID=A0A1S1YVD9_FLAPC|nr:biotin synthase BioB [Flammeovirga pacifica]OHX64994.1 biotin synthase BioB [Flammeovirga pacifica]